MATFMLGVLRRGAGSRWDPERVLLTVCDPDALPNRYLGVTVIRGDRMGMSIRFPTEWLFQAIDQRALIPAARLGERNEESLMPFHPRFVAHLDLVDGFQRRCVRGDL